jgi:hypothetical protein
MLPAFGGPLLRVPRAVLQTSFVPPPVLGAFTKLREATISFVMSVCPTAWNNSATTGRIFIKIYICGLPEKLSRKFKV